MLDRNCDESLTFSETKQGMDSEAELDQSIRSDEAADHELCASEEVEGDKMKNPYGFVEKDTSFGVMKKSTYFPKSDFSLNLLHFVSADHLTGYICTVKRDHDEQERYTILLLVSSILNIVRKNA